MRRTEFLAVGCREPTAVGECLVRQGWNLREVRNEVLSGVGVRGSHLECRHAESPVLVLLARGPEDLRVTGVRRGGGDCSWIELLEGTRHQLRRAAHDDVLRTALACAAAPVLAL